MSGSRIITDRVQPSKDVFGQLGDVRQGRSMQVNWNFAVRITLVTKALSVMDGGAGRSVRAIHLTNVDLRLVLRVAPV